MMSSMVDPIPRLRRSPSHVRALVLGAAHDLFKARGFANTSVREIAQAAGVTESVLFRHFATKEKLFEDAALAPFLSFIDAFITEWSERPPEKMTPELIAGDYIRQLYTLCVENRELLAALARGPGESTDLSGPCDSARTPAYLSALTSRVESYVIDAGLTTAGDLAMSVRFTVALVLGMTVFEHELVEPGHADAETEQTVEEMTEFILRGAGYRPSSP